MPPLRNIAVKPSRQFPFLARHPWVHVQSLIDSDQEIPLGEEVDLVQHDGTWLARGLYNPSSRLRVRLYSWNRHERLDDAFWFGRIDQALERRRLSGLWDAGPNRSEDRLQTAARLIFSEADGLSGLIVDQYAEYLVVQIAAGVISTRLETILDHLERRVRPVGIFVRTDQKTAQKEGLSIEDGLVRGSAPEDVLWYQQNQLMWSVDLLQGQKTGGFLDQRDNHAAAAKYLIGRTVLDLCCYTGGFGMVAARNGAREVVGVDSSEPALQIAQANADRNGVKNIRFHREDCFDHLAKLNQHESSTSSQESQQRPFDAVILDPPRFAGSRRQVEAALRAYGRLNRMAVKLLPPGGILVTCSCSGSVSRSDFLNMLVDVGRRVGKDIVVLESRGASVDHAMRVSCPETDYLKCMICQVSG